MTADTSGSVQSGPSVLSHADGLMSAVGTRYAAAAAADAALTEEVRVNNGIALKDVGCLADGIQRKSACLGKAFEILFGQIQIQACLQVVNNAVAVLHDGRCDLDGIRTQKDELQCVLPGLYAAHAAQVHALELRVLTQLGKKAQGDGPDGTAAVAAHGRHAVYSREET